MKKNYKNYSEINQQLEILKIEREIRYYKICQSTHSITNNFSLINLFKLGVSSVGNTIGNSKQLKVLIYTSVLKFFIKKFFKRK